MTTAPKYSVVIPCYRSERSITELLERLVSQFERMQESFEVICVDDSSPDNVADNILKFHYRDSRIKLIRLFRNYGQHHALLVGFSHAQGEFVITIDDDLQHSPEDIPLLIEALGDNDVVLGVPDTKKHAAYKNLGSWLMRLIVRKVFNPPPGFDSSAFRLIRRSVKDQLISVRTAYPYITGMIFRITRKVGTIRISHSERKYGKSGYSLTKLVLLASNLVINYTKIPLHFLTYTGLLISIISFVLILYIVIGKLFFIDFRVGWPSLIVVISFFGGINLLAFSIIAEYLIRLLNEVSETQKPVIRDMHFGSGCSEEIQNDNENNKL